MKQSKLRKRRVWRYAVLYFLLLVIFVALIVGPIVAGKNILTESLLNQQILQDLFQPINQDNNDTLGFNETGTAAKSNIQAKASATNTRGSRMIRLL
jgi:1,3-beta-glucan synthase